MFGLQTTTSQSYPMINFHQAPAFSMPAPCPQVLPAGTRVLYYDERQGRVVSDMPSNLMLSYHGGISSIAPPPGYSFVYLTSISTSKSPSQSPQIQIPQNFNSSALSNNTSHEKNVRQRSRSVSPDKGQKSTSNLTGSKAHLRASESSKSTTAGASPCKTKHKRIETLLHWMEETFGEAGHGIYNMMQQTEGANVIRVDVKTIPGVDLFAEVLEQIMNVCTVSAISTRSSLKRNKQRKGISVYIKLASRAEIHRSKNILSRNNCGQSNTPYWIVREIPANPRKTVR